MPLPPADGSAGAGSLEVTVSRTFAGSFFVAIALLLLAPAPGARAAGGPFRVYVFTTADSTKPDDAAQKARQESVRDLEDILRKGGSSLMRPGAAGDSDLTIEVISRVVEAVGRSVTTDQIDVQGKHVGRERSGWSVGGHKLVVRMSVPKADVRQVLTSTDLSWRSAAKLTIKQVHDWVKANASSIGRSGPS
jgi:hypothetical protein